VSSFDASVVHQVDEDALVEEDGASLVAMVSLHAGNVLHRRHAINLEPHFAADSVGQGGALEARWCALFDVSFRVVLLQNGHLEESFAHVELGRGAANAKDHPVGVGGVLVHAEPIRVDHFGAKGEQAVPFGEVFVETTADD